MLAASSLRRSRMSSNHSGAPRKRAERCDRCCRRRHIGRAEGQIGTIAPTAGWGVPATLMHRLASKPKFLPDVRIYVVDHVDDAISADQARLAAASGW